MTSWRTRSGTARRSRPRSSQEDSRAQSAGSFRPSSRSVDIVIPPAGMPPGAGEPVPAGEVGQGRPTELADGADDRGGLERAAVVQGEVPGRTALVELGGGDRAAEAEVWVEAVLGDQRVQVSQDLVPAREAPAPAPGPEREGV